MLVLMLIRTIIDSQTHGSDTIDINKRQVAGVLNVMKCIGRYVANFTLADFKGGFLFPDKSCAFTRQEYKRFFVGFRAVLSALIALFQIYPARAHP